jgi:endonuclease/exonuclease/phosphatase family metal-dependent hydrolase
VTHASSRGTFLTWGGVSATGFDVQQATNPSMTRSRHTFEIRSRHAAAHQFTPGASAAYGHRYYWRVRAWNSGTPSAWSRVVSARIANHLWSVRLMTYNLLNRELVGRMWPCGIRVAPWSARKWPAVRVVQSYHPDILAMQEAGEKGGTSVTQGQDLVHGLGASYRIANTDVGSRTVAWAGNYIAYKPSRFRVVGGGGHWNLPSKGARGVYDAVYQEFAARSNPRARFLFVNTHLPPFVGYGFDRLRYKETTYIIQHARALAARRGGIRVVYAGDFNSFPSPNWHPLDGPQLAMRNAFIPSDGTLALYRWNSAYASRNRYCIRPPTDHINLDYIWVSPGVVAGSWGIVLRLNSKHQYNLPIPSDHNPVAGTVGIPY